jgi:hypothetical protein
MSRTAEGIATPYGPLSRELTALIRETRPELLCPLRRSTPRRWKIATAAVALVGAATPNAGGKLGKPVQVQVD